MKRIAVINQKGGVGKTTTTANTGAALARMGYKVLLIDMDPQANLTVHLDQSPDLEQKTLTRLLVDDTPLEELVLPASADNLFIVPADTSLAGVEQVLANRIGRETILREALEAFPQADLFDYCLLDCPPSLGVLSANALVAADRVLVPVQAEYLSLQGMAKLMEVIQLVQKRLTPGLEIACILPCMVDQRTNLTAEVLAEIEHHFGDLLAKTRIRSNVKLAEAPSFGRSIFDHAPDSNGAADYGAFAAEFVQLPSIRALGPDRDVSADAEAAADASGSEDARAGQEPTPAAAAVDPTPPPTALTPDRQMIERGNEAETGAAGPAADLPAADLAAADLPGDAHRAIPDDATVDAPGAPSPPDPGVVPPAAPAPRPPAPQQAVPRPPAPSTGAEGPDPGPGSGPGSGGPEALENSGEA